MRIRAADEDGVSLPIEVHIVRVAPLAAHELRILLAGDRLADAELHQGKIGGAALVVHERSRKGVAFEPCSRPGPPEASKRRSRRGSPELRA